MHGRHAWRWVSYPRNSQNSSTRASGAGDAVTPMMITLIQTPISVAAQWILAFGHFGLPAMGIRGIAIGAVRTVSELAETEWAQQRQLVSEPVAGLRFPRVPYRSTRSDIGAGQRAPHRGEHNREVFGRLLGLDEIALDELVKRGALSGES